MRCQICLACMLVAILAGCSRKAPEPSQEEPKELIAQAPQTNHAMPAADASLEVGTVLSTNTVVVGGNVSITASLVNTEKPDVTVNRNDLSVWLSVTDSMDAPITELPIIDRISAPGEGSPLVVSAGGSEIVRVFGAQVTKGRWKGFGTAGAHEGVGLVVQREAGASCYPLKSIPGEYSLRCHLRIKTSGAGSPAVEVVSEQVKMSVTADEKEEIKTLISEVGIFHWNSKLNNRKAIWNSVVGVARPKHSHSLPQSGNHHEISLLHCDHVLLAAAHRRCG
jgi:hypothetical protein